MHASLFTVAGAALALSIAAFRAPQPPQGAAAIAQREALEKYQSAMEQAQKDKAQAAAVVAMENQKVIEDYRRALDDMKIQNEELQRRIAALAKAAPAKASAFEPGTREGDGLRFDVAFRDAPLSQVFDQIAKLASRPANLHWDALRAAGYEPDSTVTVTGPGMTVTQLLAALSRASDPGASLECRISDTVEIATRAYFDRQEQDLVSYDLSGIVAARATSYAEPRQRVMEEVSRLIVEFVSPSDWRDNGGELAELTIVGDRLFIRAPRRMHPQIQWIISQLPAGPLNPERTHAAGTASPETVQYRLRHVDAKQLFDAFNQSALKQNIKLLSCTLVPAANSLLISATVEEQAKAKALIEELDRADNQGSSSAEGGLVYLSGLVSRPGTYQAPAEGLTLRRLLAASGGLNDKAELVDVCETRDGKSVPVVSINARDLREPAGADPTLKPGQIVNVR